MPPALHAMLRQAARLTRPAATALSSVRPFSGPSHPPSLRRSRPPRWQSPSRHDPVSEAPERATKPARPAYHRNPRPMPNASYKSYTRNSSSSSKLAEESLVQFCLETLDNVAEFGGRVVMGRTFELVERRRRLPQPGPHVLALVRQTVLALAGRALVPEVRPALTVTDQTFLLYQLLFLRVPRDPSITALEDLLVEGDRLTECPRDVLVKLVRFQADNPAPNPAFVEAAGRALAQPDVSRELYAKDVSILLHSFGRLDQQHPVLFEALQGRLMRGGGAQIERLTSQGVSNCLWAAARLGLHDAELVAALVDQALTLGLDQFTSQGVANTAWALATMGHCDDRFMAALVDRLTSAGLQEFKPQELANTVWAVATLGHKDAALLARFAQFLVGRGLHGFKAQELANTAWAFATLGFLHKPLMHEVIAHFLLLGPPAFKPQELSNLLWAFAALEHDPGALAEAVTRHVQRCNLAQFKPLEISNLLWAVATLGLNAETMLEAAGDHLSACNLGEFRHHEVSISTWAFATCAYLHRPMMQAVGGHLAQRRLAGIQPQGVANLMWAFATLLPTEPTTVRRLMEYVAASGLEGYTDQGVSNIAWACAVAGFVDDAFFASIMPSIAHLVAGTPHIKVLLQLHQFLAHCDLHATQLPLTTAALDRHPDVLWRCAEAFERISNVSVHSQFHEEVAAVLQSAGVAIRKEVVLRDAGMYSVDILLEGTRTVIEVDGPWHFLRCGDGWVPSGPTHLKRFQLEGFGYTCISVPFYEWPVGSHDRAAYLQCFLPDLNLTPAARPRPQRLSGSRGRPIRAVSPALAAASGIASPAPI